MIGVLAAAAIVAVVCVQAAVLSRRYGRRPAAQAAAVAPARTAPRPTHPLAWAVDVLRRRVWVRRSLSGLSVIVMLVAIGMIGYPFYTNLVQQRIQSRLDRQLASPELRQAYEQRRVQEGDSLTRIRIPSIDVDVVVVQGTKDESLKAGAGHYDNTAMPCEDGNVAIAGHRTTYGRPFADLDLLRPGDEIILETPVNSCTYVLEKRPYITTPDDIAVLDNKGDDRLTLTTCHPKGSARQRLIVVAMLSGEPVAT